MGRVFALVLLVACAACGRLNFESRDPLGDDAADSLVTITALLDGTPVAGEVALFHDAAGSLLFEMRTDADGRAAAPVPAGGTASWAVVLPIVGQADSLLLTSVFDVQPGDDLVVAAAALPFVTRELDVDVPIMPNAVEYRVHLPCGITSFPQAGLNKASLRSSCVTAGTYTALATAVNSAGITIGSSLLQDVDVAATMLSFPLWIANFDPIDFSAPDLPAGAASCRISALPVLAGEISTSAAFERRASASNCAAGFVLEVDPTLDDWVFNLAYAETATDYRVNTGEVIRSSTPTTLVAGGDHLPLYPGLSLSSSGARVAIDHAGPLTAVPDALHVTAAWLPAGTTGAVVWEVMMPPDRPTPYLLPELPTSLAAYAPGELLGAQLVVLETTDVAGYDDLRRRFGTLAFGRSSPLVAPGKRVRLSRSTFEVP